MHTGVLRARPPLESRSDWVGSGDRIVCAGHASPSGDVLPLGPAQPLCHSHTGRRPCRLPLLGTEMGKGLPWHSRHACDMGYGTPGPHAWWLQQHGMCDAHHGGLLEPDVDKYGRGAHVCCGGCQCVSCARCLHPHSMECDRRTPSRSPLRKNQPRLCG